MSVLNLKRIALFVQSYKGISPHFESGSRDPCWAHLGVILWSIRRRGRPTSLYQIWSRLLNSFKSY